MNDKNDEKIRQNAREFFENNIKTFFEKFEVECDICKETNCISNKKCKKCNSDIGTTTKDIII